MRYRFLQLSALALAAAFTTGCSPLIAGVAMLVRRNADDSTITVGRTVSGTTTGGGDDFAPQCGGHRNGDDEEWIFVPATSGRYDIEVNGDYDCVVALFRTENREHMACNDDTNSTRHSRISPVLEAGQSYTIVVDGYRGASGSYDLTVTGRGPVQTGGTLTVGQAVNGSTEGGTDRYTPPCGSRAGSPDNVWEFTPTTAGRYEVTVEGGYDCNVAVYRPGVDQPLACNDDSGSTTRSRVTVGLEAAQTYHVVVDGYSGRSGSYRLLVTARGEIQSGGTLVAGQSVNGTTEGGTDNYTPPCGSRPGSPDSVWEFTPTTAGRYEVTVDGDYDCNVAVYRPGVDRPLACNDDSGSTTRSRVTVGLDAGQTYHVVVDGYASNSGSYRLLMTELGEIQSGGTLSVGQSVNGSTREGTDNYTPPCGSRAGSPDNVWTFTPPSSGTYEVAVDGDYDCTVAVYADGNPQPLGCNDDSGSVSRSLLRIGLQAGQSYHVVVDGYAGRSGTYSLVVREAQLPAAGGQGENTEALEQACAGAAVLSPGITQGRIAAGNSAARLSCGAGGRGPETVYRIVVDRPGMLTVAEESSFDAVLELRQGCSRGARVMICNDDTGDTRHSTITAPVEQGTYYLIVDAYGQSVHGPFTLNMTFAPREGQSAAQPNAPTASGDAAPEESPAPESP